MSATPMVGALARQRVTPATDRRVPLLSVACPSCGARVGEYCRNADGRSDKNLRHRPRRTMALRAGH